MATNTVKDEEGVKIMKPKVEEIKTQVETIIKKIIKKQKLIENMERDIYGIPDKEIKENVKKTDPKRFRNIDPAA
jgi:Mn-dependent DtxR family transcriptional regulator